MFRFMERPIIPGFKTGEFSAFTIKCTDALSRPMCPELYLRSVNVLGDAEKEMLSIDVCREGINIMLPKTRHFIFMVRDLDPRGANILKQEMLAVGGEAAISYSAICDITKPTDCLLSGTERQFSIAMAKLRLQPFGLKSLAGQLEFGLLNLGRNRNRVLEPLALGRTLVMGILNVTPDSFSGDGVTDAKEAVRRAIQMEADGADIIDIGGESTRPDAAPVTTEEEAARVIPVIKSLAGELKIPISVDSRNPEVVEKALGAGARIVNLVGGLRDRKMSDILAKTDVPIILMHMQGEPGTMQKNPVYRDLMDDIVAELRKQVAEAEAAGIDPGRIILDPGIGFGKTAEHNLEIIRRLGEMRITGMPIMIGASRKSFIGKTLGGEPAERLEGSIASATAAAMNGADIVRVHDVRETVLAMRMADAIFNPSLRSIK